MFSTLLAAPAAEPVSLAEAKAHLRIDNSAEDAVISERITAARNFVEAATGLRLIDQQWRFTLDRWPDDGLVRFRAGPLKSLDATRLRDEAGTATSLALSNFDLVAGANAIRLRTRPADPGRPIGGIELELTLGFGASAASVPPPLREAMLQLLAYWHENRGDGEGAGGMPDSIARLLAPFRKRRIA